MRWSRATFSFYFACILLCSARAVHRRHNARVLTLKPEDNGTVPVPDVCSTRGQVAHALWDVLTNACIFISCDSVVEFAC